MTREELENILLDYKDTEIVCRRYLEKLEENNIFFSSPDYSKEKVKSYISIDSHFAELIETKNNIARQIVREYEEYMQITKRLLKIFNYADTPKQTAVLRMHYLERLTIDQIADELFYTRRSICRFLADAKAAIVRNAPKLEEITPG